MGLLPRAVEICIYHYQELQLDPAQEMKLLILTVCIAAALLEGTEGQDGAPTAARRAPDSSIRCCCQCDSYTYNVNGITYGNCKSTYQGKDWCYVDPDYNDCQDTKASVQFEDRSWSYQACSTPALSSSECAWQYCARRSQPGGVLPRLVPE